MQGGIEARQEFCQGVLRTIDSPNHHTSTDRFNGDAHTSSEAGRLSKRCGQANSEVIVQLFDDAIHLYVDHRFHAP